MSRQQALAGACYRAQGLSCGMRLRFGTEDDAWQADKSKMTEMFSQQAEKVTFERPVEVKGAPSHHFIWPHMPASPLLHANPPAQLVPVATCMYVELNPGGMLNAAERLTCACR